MCFDCQKYLANLLIVTNDSDDNYLFNNYVNHRNNVIKQRNYFNKQKQECKQLYIDFCENNNPIQYSDTLQLSFDFMKNLKFPNFSQQPGILNKNLGLGSFDLQVFTCKILLL